MGYSPWSCKELNTTERLTLSLSLGMFLLQCRITGNDFLALQLYDSILIREDDTLSGLSLALWILGRCNSFLACITGHIQDSQLWFWLALLGRGLRKIQTTFLLTNIFPLPFCIHILILAKSC